MNSNAQLVSSLKASWDSIAVEYSRMLPSEGDLNIPKNLVSVAFTPQDLDPESTQDGGKRKDEV